MFISPNERPSRMFRAGRPVVPDFAPPEGLYRRYQRTHFFNGELLPAAFAFPRQSLNRSAFSEPQDVLFSEVGAFDGWGVLEFVVGDVPESIDGAAFFMMHVPYEDNYAHSELWSGSPAEYKEPSPAIRKKLRAHLAARITVRLVAVR